MSSKTKEEREEKQSLKMAEESLKKSYSVLYAVVFAVFVILTGISYYIGCFSVEEFIVNILNNIIGIIPPLLIFDFFIEKLSKDASAIETSNKITETLMGRPETLDLFTEDQREQFIHSAIESIVDDEDATEMIYNNLHNYLALNNNYKIRTEFAYDLQFDNDLPAAYDVLKNKSNYFYVQEKLHYKVKYLSQDMYGMNSKTISIGFVFNNLSLDNMLREKQNDSDFDACIFRECLDIEKEDVDVFKSFDTDPDKLKQQFQELIRLDVQIDNVKGSIDKILMKENGILVKLSADYDITAKEHAVRILFHMPKRWNSILEIALVDPTKAPKISASYPEDKMLVNMYPFLSKGEESSLEVAHEHLNGIYDIVLNNEWIYPISGMVFSVTKK